MTMIPPIAHVHIPRFFHVPASLPPAAFAANIAVALSTITLLTYTKPTAQAATAIWHSIIAAICILNGRMVFSIQRICFISVLYESVVVRDGMHCRMCEPLLRPADIRGAIPVPAL